MSSSSRCDRAMKPIKGVIFDAATPDSGFAIFRRTFDAAEHLAFAVD